MMYYQIRQQSLADRWWDIVSGNVQPEDTRTGDEIAFDVITKLGLRVKQ